MIDIKRFNPETAHTSHEGTILAENVLPDGMKAPFEHQYGYLLKGKSMSGHAHDDEEVYIVVSGSGHVLVAGENRAVSAGDVIAIPSNTWHTMMCAEEDEAPFLWAALWWKKAD